MGEWAGARRVDLPSSAPLWMSVYVCAPKTQKKKKKDEDQKTKKKNATRGGAAAEESPSTSPTLTSTSSTSTLPPLLVLRAVSTRGKIVRAAAIQGQGLAKRDIDGARAYVVVAADGQPCVPPIELVAGDSAPVCDGAGVVVVVDGADLAACPADVLAEMAGRSGELAGCNSQVEAKRRERVEAREAQEEEQSSQRPVLLWKHTQNNGYLSSKFLLDGRVFTSGEQYIMWSKARVMGDERTADMIMGTNDPSRQKKLGRQVHPWKPKIWARHRETVQLRAATAKFGQNRELGDRLIRTYPKRIAEASPSDTVYGIGLAPHDPRALDPNNWRGQNILGRTLERVRGALMEEAAAAET